MKQPYLIHLNATEAENLRRQKVAIPKNPFYYERINFQTLSDNWSYPQKKKMFLFLFKNLFSCGDQDPLRILQNFADQFRAKELQAPDFISSNEGVAVEVAAEED